MYKVLSKDKIELEIVPYIPVGKRGFKSKVPLCEIINCILYKLKTGIQWYLLPIFQLFSKEVINYKTVFGYYRKWIKQGYGRLVGVVFYKRTEQKLIYPVEM